MYNIFNHSYYEGVDILDYVSRKIYRSDKEKLFSILDKYFNKNRLNIKRNNIEVSVSAISAVVTFIYLGKTLDENLGNDPYYRKLNKDVALKMGCSPNYKDYSHKVNVGSLDIILFGKPDIFCENIPGEVKAISIHSPNDIRDYQILKGRLQAEMYGFILKSPVAILDLVYHRGHNEGFHIDGISQNLVKIDRKELERMIKLVLSKAIIPYLFY